MPLHLFIEKTGTKAYLRLQDQLPKPWKSSTTFTHPHILGWEEMTNTPDILTFDDRYNITTYDRRFQVNLESFDGHPDHIRPSEYTVYSNGSKTKDRAGAGTDSKLTVLVYPTTQLYFQQKFKPYYRYINSVEFLLYHCSKHIVIYVKTLCNSQAALTAISNTKIKSCTVQKAVDTLNCLASHTKCVHLASIKAHI